jgi:hypothetical protein
MPNTDGNAGAGWAEQVERLARLVPGVAAYQDREGLRETDKRVRAYVAELLGGVGKELEPAQRRLAEGRWLDRLPALDRIGRRLGTLADRVRFASYGFAGVFALYKIGERELAQLHDCDVHLLEEIPRLQSAVRAAADQAGEADGFPAAAQAAEDALRHFEHALEDRERLARGL